MSTQQAVTRGLNAVAFALACWVWLLLVAVAAGITGWIAGASAGVAAAAALALAPALAGFALVVHLGGRVADAGWISVWLLGATALIMLTGGASSPL
ncbi:MAG: hypothetical protein ABL883_10805, partial [Terricaulis sp.]